MNLPSPDQRAQVAAIDPALHLSSSNNENSEIHDDNSLAQLAQAAVAATLDGNSSVPVDLALLLPSNSSKEINEIIEDDKEEHPIRERVTFNLPAFHARWIKQETLQDRCRLIATALTYSTVQLSVLASSKAWRDIRTQDWSTRKGFLEAITKLEAFLNAPS
ncbi:hypothetical protein B5807_02232 [Epicoccum nigrum]|uniref:Uncharacterized protein n=1 Tax=Epicoccum nigrum TaxID=105696 RepID=A0A1Y2MB15_EPING|nr:hypothetical protein B5807_02232 [Epicoccum nigrum]